MSLSFLNSMLSFFPLVVIRTLRCEVHADKNVLHVHYHPAVEVDVVPCSRCQAMVSCYTKCDEAVVHVGVLVMGEEEVGRIYLYVDFTRGDKGRVVYDDFVHLFLLPGR